jgi:hypothetical protein
MYVLQSGNKSVRLFCYVTDRNLRCPVVPECDASRLPLESTRELRFNLMLEDIIQQRRTFFCGPAVESLRMSNVDVNAFVTSLNTLAYAFNEYITTYLRMCSNCWMI